MAPVHEVAFELECFEWAEERLEVAGRWKGLGAHRLNRPVLTVDTDSGRRKRIVALPGGHLGVTGETWRATFAWPGDPTEITGAELEVGGSLVVDLPLPDRRRRRRRRPGMEQHSDEALRVEVGALRGQVDRLRAELAGREREIIALRAQLDQEAGDGEDEPARSGADDRTVELQQVAGAEEMTVEIQRLVGEVERLHEEKRAGAEEMTVEIRRLVEEVERLQEEKAAGAGAMTNELERLAAERDAASAETDAAVAAERERWQTDIDELRQAFADAAAEAEEARDRHRAALAALEDQLREERAHVAHLSTQLAADAERERAAGPQTVPTPPGDASAGEPTEPVPPPGEPSAGEPTQPMPPPRDPTQPMPPPNEPTAGAPGEATIEAAVLDAPGPLRAGSRPANPVGTEDGAPLVAGEAGHEGGGSAFQALKARVEGLFASNGDGQHDDADDERAVPRPRRTAAAARARAGATVAARRSPGEVWATRVLAAVVVAVLLTAFVLILAYIA
jgi:hypothetical protein